MNPEKEVKKIIQFIRDYYQKNNLKGAIIGISGGKDSAVCAALMCKALGKENVLGFTLPCHSKDEDKIDAKLISDYYGFKLLNFDLTEIFDCFKKELGKVGNFSEEEMKNSDINLKPRLRMSTLYYFAALYTSIMNKPYLVVGTSNKCELYLGYFTKGGDSVCDIRLLNDLTVSEVIKIGEYLKIPKNVLYKTPSDGLSSSSDEEKLGIKYSELEKYFDNSKAINKDIVDKIEKHHQNNLHKFNIPSYWRNE